MAAAVIRPGRAAVRRITEHVVAVWHDLSHPRVAGPQMSFVSVFDDTTDVWSEEDFKLVDDLSEVGVIFAPVRWPSGARACARRDA